MINVSEIKTTAPEVFKTPFQEKVYRTLEELSIPYTNSRSTYRQTLGYNKFTLRQAPLSGNSLSAVAFQGPRSDLIELILSVDFVYRTIEN